MESYVVVHRRSDDFNLIGSDLKAGQFVVSNHLVEDEVSAFSSEINHFNGRIS